MTSIQFASVVLAAGEGRRAGGYKPLFSFDKEVRFIDNIIRSAGAVCAEVRVVGGACFSRLEDHVSSSYPDVTLIRNTRWKSGGMFSSVQKGLDGVDLPCFIHPADIPGPSAAVYRALADKWKICKADVLRPTFNGVSGHPILVSEETVGDILRASPSSVLREILREKPRLDVPVSEQAVLKDYDTRDDLRGLENGQMFGRE